MKKYIIESKDGYANIIEYNYEEVIVYLEDGTKKVYKDVLKDIENVLDIIYLTFQNSKGVRYKVIVYNVSNCIQTYELISKSCETLVPSSRRMDKPFYINNNKIFPVADSKKSYYKIIINVSIISLIAIMLLCFIDPIANNAWVSMVIILVIFVGFIIGLVVLKRYIYRNHDRRDYPAIGLTEDGGFIIFHSYNSIEYLKDRIIDVTSQRDSIILGDQNSSISNVTKTAPISENGQVIFTLMRESGSKYKKTATAVMKCDETAEFIRSLMIKR